ncbi:MAG: NAD(P)-dependent oxidoreductase, partial [Thermoguttaceae bacterium]
GEDVFSAAAGVRVEPAGADEAALAAAVRAQGCRAVIVGVHPYRGQLYQSLASVAGEAGALIARFGVGHDSIDKALAAAHGIRVTNTPGVLDQSVAEHTLWLMGALARNVPASDARLRDDQFRGEAGIELGGKLLGIAGCGAIGRRVAAMAHFGLGMRVLAADCRPAEQLECELGLPCPELFARWGVDDYTTDTDRVFREADVVSIHLPALPETRNYVNTHRLAQMGRGAMLVNTARGSIVDEAALFDALAAGRIAGAALDVYQQEPYVPADPARDLRQLDNIVLTPHIGSNTREANRRMAEASLANAVHFLAGRLDALTPVPPPAGLR